jgi:hypothetical protein
LFIGVVRHIQPLGDLLVEMRVFFVFDVVEYARRVDVAAIGQAFAETFGMHQQTGKIGFRLAGSLAFCLLGGDFYGAV